MLTRCLMKPTDPGLSEELDQAVVLPKARRAADLQDPQNRSLGWHSLAECMQAD